jgi:hypothetical protein
MLQGGKEAYDIDEGDGPLAHKVVVEDQVCNLWNAPKEFCTNQGAGGRVADSSVHHELDDTSEAAQVCCNFLKMAVIGIPRVSDRM